MPLLVSGELGHRHSHDSLLHSCLRNWRLGGRKIFMARTAKRHLSSPEIGCNALESAKD
jgi:hypothetical protein